MNEVMLRSEDGKVSLIGMIEMIDDAQFGEGDGDASASATLSHSNDGVKMPVTENLYQ